jgi:hypothetical protein
LYSFVKKIAAGKGLRHLEAWVRVGRGAPHEKDFVSLSELNYLKKIKSNNK